MGMATQKNNSKKPTKVAAKKLVKATKKTVKKSKKTAAKKAKKKGETLMCFLTTACVNYYSLPDDGNELSTLRHYRDNYLASSKGGKRLIEQYYHVSPKIVALVEKDRERKSVYEYIYSEIKMACAEIENKNLLSAKKVYVGMVTSLMKRYGLG
jgi:hypothetical protein